MAEGQGTDSRKMLEVRHRGRIAQIGIYFMKFVKMFANQNDWKVIPMAALISGLVGFVMSRNFMRTMEGTLTGSFALVCVCVWNGSFNSIQVICRERDVVKREHRSGMHITSYVISHMLYQLLLCLMQTVVTVVVTRLAGMNYPSGGLFTKWFVLDFGITIFLVTYAADIMSLWISALSRTTTAAMTVMPFILVFQLLFSGGVIQLPANAKWIAMFTVSNPGFKAVAAQADANSYPINTVSTLLDQVDDAEVNGQITVGQVTDALTNPDNKTIGKLRSVKVGDVATIGEMLDELATSKDYEELRNQKLLGNATWGDLLIAMNESSEEFLGEYRDKKVGFEATVGSIVDHIVSLEGFDEYRDYGITITTTVGDILDMVGKENVQKMISDKASQMRYNHDYEPTTDNVSRNWIQLGIFILLFGVLSIITLEFIDKDKR